MYPWNARLCRYINTITYRNERISHVPLLYKYLKNVIELLSNHDKLNTSDVTFKSRHIFGFYILKPQ